MGLIRATAAAARGILADQWLEFFYCHSIEENTLMKVGQKETKGGRSNVKGADNVISNGSKIAVADGQCMIIVDQGKVVEVCAEPGEFIYDSSSEPSIFYGSLGENIVDSFKTLGKRIAFGGQEAREQYVYYINTKQIMNNKYGTPSRVPFRVVINPQTGAGINISVGCHGQYIYQIEDPIRFYQLVGNVEHDYTRDKIDGQLKSELISAFQPALARISAMGVSYSEIQQHTPELREALEIELSKSWRELRGIGLVKITLDGVKASKEDEEKIDKYEQDLMLSDPTLAAARLVAANAEATKLAAANEGAGPMMAFMGMNMVGKTAGASNIGDLYNMGNQQPPPNQPPPQHPSPQQPPPQHNPPAPAGWLCACGNNNNTGKFCAECGKSQPVMNQGWSCSCGATNSSKFCSECGKAQPEDSGWSCSCGATNKGRFCSECGKPKPAGALLYQCDKCQWEPEDPQNPPKFCPECGDIFDENDIVK